MPRRVAVPGRRVAAAPTCRAGRNGGARMPGPDRSGNDEGAERDFRHTPPLRLYNPGGVLLSRGVAPEVPSALEDFTTLFGMGRGVSPPLWPPERSRRHSGLQTSRAGGRRGPESYIAARVIKSSPRPISTGLLNMLPCLHILPINQVVYLGPYPLEVVGHLILRRASRLDAFSGYLFQT